MPLQQRLSVADELREGLAHPAQKILPAHYLYDEIGSALFDVITALPEYGLTRADERLLREHSRDIASLAPVKRVLDLGSGSGGKTRTLLSAFSPDVIYTPIDVSRSALDRCVSGLSEWRVEPIEAEFLPGLKLAASARSHGPELVTFLGSNIGNIERPEIVPFLKAISSRLTRGDFLLLGADLLKPVQQLVAAYDDAAGVTAAFNRNLLVRFNREFEANFNPHCFDHVALWNEPFRRIEMHLRASEDQRIFAKALDLRIVIRAGETIHTESSHKFECSELANLAAAAGFDLVSSWIDDEWPFAEMLLRIS